MRIWNAVVLAMGFCYVGSVLAQDGDAAPPPVEDTTPNVAVNAPPVHQPNWDYALDLRAATIAETVTPLVAAQWNRIFRSTDTELGLAASALPRTVKKDLEVGTAKLTQYSYGLNVAQPFWADEAFRLGVGLVVGRGINFVRSEVDGETADFEGINFTLVEPNIFFTFYAWRSMDLGVAASYRIAMAPETETVTAKDLSSVTFGVTFRERRTL